jgi:serine/threonine protein kinase
MTSWGTASRVLHDAVHAASWCSKLTKTLVPYTEKEASSIMRTVLLVLRHCHAMGVLHR